MLKASNGTGKVSMDVDSGGGEAEVYVILGAVRIIRLSGTIVWRM